MRISATAALLLASASCVSGFAPQYARRGAAISSPSAKRASWPKILEKADGEDTQAAAEDTQDAVEMAEVEDRNGVADEQEKETLFEVEADHQEDEDVDHDVVDEESESEEIVQEKDEQSLFDEANMQKAIDLVIESGGDRGEFSAYPLPTTAALLVSSSGETLGKGCSDYSRDSVQIAMEDAGLDITPLQQWCVTWPSSDKLRKEIADATLYLTMEPNHNRRGQALPPITQLIELSGVKRVVIGCPHPVPSLATKGSSALFAAGIEVTMGNTLMEECKELISDYAERANGKLQRMARKHFEYFQRPLGFLHCSVVDSDNLEAFANHGNAFGREFDGKRLSYRDFGAYEIAPPPEVIWAESEMDDEDDDDDMFFDDDKELDEILALEFEDEEFQESMKASPMMPWYEQVEAVVATFPHPGSNGPGEDNSVAARLNGLKWLATHGETLPPGVERILVMDATDLEDLPLSNDDPNLPKGVDIEKFWKAEGRKPSRVLLRRGASAQAQTAAKVAADAAAAAARAAVAAQEAIETGDAEMAAKAALEGQQAATAASEMAQKELMRSLELKQKLANMGALVETLNGGEPIDVMNHLGKRNGYKSVVWRAGCWGGRGVRSILAGAFQWVSAHLAVDAHGGKFWQLMLAEHAVQGACGPESRVKVFAAQEDISLEYCDNPEADGDCTMTVDGKPVRHVRLDCRVALVDPERPRAFVLHKTKPIDKKVIEEEAPWFL